MSKLKHKMKVLLTVNLFAVGIMHAVNQMIASSAVLKNILKPGSGKRMPGDTGMFSIERWERENLFF